MLKLGIALASAAALCIATTGCGEDDARSSGPLNEGGAGTGGAQQATGSPASSGTSASSGVGTGGAGEGGGASTGGGGAGGSGPAPGICPGGPYAPDPLPGDRTARRVRGGFSFVEGPVWFAELGALLFSDMNFGAQYSPPRNGPRSTIHKLTPPDTVEEFIGDAGSNGLGIGRDGSLIACTHDTRGISTFDLRTKARATVVDRYMGRRFNSPNDIAVRGDGNLYFSDPDWQLSGASELPMAVYRVAPSGDVSVVDTLDKPNGVALSPDEATLYVGAIDGKIRRYAVGADGAVGGASDFAFVGGPDGMAVDCAGDLYVTGQAGVEVFSPGGAHLGTIGGTGTASNAAFGGPDRKTLYVTAGDALYAIALNIPGYPY